MNASSAAENAAGGDDAASGGVTCAHIPTTMTRSGLAYLQELAAAAPRGAVMIDIGAFYGAATCAMANTAEEPARIYAIDPWQGRKWIEEWAERHGAPPFSREAFLHYVRGLDMVEALPGRAQDVLRKIDAQMDFVFIDAVGNDPDFSDILSAATAILRPGGIICGEGFSIRFPELVHAVENLAAAWHARPAVKGRVWALRGPLESGGKSPGLADALRVDEQPGLMVTADCDFDHAWRALPECWGGRPARAGAMRAFRLDWLNRPEGVDVRYRCAAAGLPMGEFAVSGEWCQADESRPPIIGVWMELAGPRAAEYELSWQAGFARDGTAPFGRKHYSRTVPGGTWIRSPNRGTPINALRVIVKRREKEVEDA